MQLKIVYTKKILMYIILNNFNFLKGVLLMKEALDIIEKKIIDLNARIKSHEMQKEYLMGGVEQLKTLSFMLKNAEINKYKKNNDVDYKTLKDIQNYDNFIQQNCC